MKYLKFIAGAMLLSLAACTDNDEPAAGGDTGGTGSTTGFYSKISIAMPPSSRSGHTNEGEEVGKDVENNVGSILFVISK